MATTFSDGNSNCRWEGVLIAAQQLVSLCCSTPPEGRSRWTLQLLVDELCRLQVVTSVCRETVRMCLKKTRSANVTG